MYTVNPFHPRKRGEAVRRLASRGALIAIIAAAGLSAGCASYDRSHFTVGSVPDDYRTRHPIVIRQDEKVEDIVVSPNARGLSYRDRSVAESFASRFNRSGAARMAILVPAGSPNSAAAKRVAQQIVPVMAEAGIDRRRIAIQSYDAAQHGDSATLRLVYLGTTAEVESPCGQWDEDIVDTTENRNYHNFGCATQKNLAAMVANPEDLLGPRGVSEIDATRRTNVINDWRDFGSDDLPILF
jgi:pilus assembly protein CpaD